MLPQGGPMLRPRIQDWSPARSLKSDTAFATVASCCESAAARL